jgi:acylphosphatase
MKSYRFLISGRVQGVWYRATVQQNAQRLGFSGYVENLPDGRVEAGVTCQDERLPDFIELLQKGSEHSRVEHIAQYELAERFDSGFVIR